MKKSITEWFCLETGRQNFQIDPIRDQRFLFGQQTWEGDIDDRLKRAELLATPVRLVWWGQFGIGKTHRLRHTEFLVGDRGYDYYPCYVVATDVQEKTGFDRLQFELVNSLRRERVHELVSKYLLRVKNGEAGVPSLEETCGSSSDVISALRSFESENQNVNLPAWKYLCGMALERDEVKLAGVTKNQLESSLDFAAVLSALARIVQVQTGKQLLFLIDECENLTKITNKTAESRWQETIRAVLDIQHLSVVFSVGAERFQDVPKLLVMSDIIRRIQKDNYVQMAAFKLPDVEQFVRNLLEKFIDPAKRSALEASENLASTPGYDAAIYPFTKGGFEKYCENAVVDPRTAKPSEILARLDRVAAEAFLANKRLIDKDLLTKLGIA